MSAAAPVAPIPRTTQLALAAMALAVFVIANDFTALSVALPKMEKDLHAGVSTLQWVINAYSLVFSVMIVTGGRLADIFGTRRIFFVGIAIFAVFSLVAGAAGDTITIIAARALMGIGGALVWPAVTAMTFGELPAERAGLAGGLILGVAGLGNSFGPMIGGLLTESASWRWVLFLNLPIALIAALAIWRWVEPTTRAEGAERERLDGWGIATVTLGLVALLVALDQGVDWGWRDGRIIGLFVLSVVGLAGFAVRQRMAGDRALIPPSLLRKRRFVRACLATLLASGTYFAVLLYAPQFTQKVLGYSALGAGVALLPMMGTFALTSFAAGPLYAKVSPRLLLTGGAVLLGVGVLALSFIQGDSGFGAMVPGLVLVGLGTGLFYSTLTTSAMTALPQEQAGLGGGLLFMFQVGGGAIGLALTTTLFTTASRDAHGNADAVFAAGLHAGFRLDAALSLVAVLLAATVVARPGGGAAPAAAAA